MSRSGARYTPVAMRYGFCLALTPLLLLGCAGGSSAPDVEVVATSGESVVYTWAEPGGGFSSSNKLESIPEAVRTKVMMVDLSAPMLDGTEVLVADLGGVLPGNVVKARRVSRASFEEAARTLAGPAPTAAPGTGVTLSSDGTGTVVLYSAAWCGICTQARKWLTAKKIPFVEKDVEKNPGAAAELKAKARATGMAYSGGVPVIDIAGRLLVGFDPTSVEGALRAAGLYPG